MTSKTNRKSDEPVIRIAQLPQYIKNKARLRQYIKDKARQLGCTPEALTPEVLLDEVFRDLEAARRRARHLTGSRTRIGTTPAVCGLRRGVPTAFASPGSEVLQCIGLSASATATLAAGQAAERCRLP
jgi:hypothetical protein